MNGQPEALLVRKWQQSHRRGRVWRCVYTENDLNELACDHADGIVRAARTPSLDDAAEDVLMARNWLPRNAATLDGGDFAAQMTAPVRQLIAGPHGSRRYVWTKPSADHHRHSDNYDKIASQLWRPKPALKIVTGGGRIF